MRVEKRKEKIEREYEIYISKDGKEFTNKNECQEYEEYGCAERLEKLDKYIVKDDDGSNLDMIPINFSAEFSQWSYYTWIRVNDVIEYLYVNQVLDGKLEKPTEYPFYYCIETESDFDGYASDYITKLDTMKENTKDFWGYLGYEVSISKK